MKSKFYEFLQKATFAICIILMLYIAGYLISVRKQISYCGVKKHLKEQANFMLWGHISLSGKNTFLGRY